MPPLRLLAGKTAHSLRFKFAMHLIDYFIIYLTCGAPFGVYYFLQNRTSESEQKFLYFKTLLNFFFWIPFALLLLRNNLSDRNKIALSNSAYEAKIQLIGKKLEEIFLSGNLPISIYEFREVFERYAGLTLAAQTNHRQIMETEKQIFRVTKESNIECGAVCLNRRNRQRLVQHQTEARNDFFNLIIQLSESDSDTANLKYWSIELAKILQDDKAAEKLAARLPAETQTVIQPAVKKTEKDLWKPETRKLSPAKQISYQPPIMKMPVSLREKD